MADEKPKKLPVPPPRGLYAPKDEKARAAPSKLPKSERRQKAAAAAKAVATTTKPPRQRAPGAGRPRTIEGNPWEALGMSRSAWYKAGKPQPEGNAP